LFFKRRIYSLCFSGAFKIHFDMLLACELAHILPLRPVTHGTPQNSLRASSRCSTRASWDVEPGRRDAREKFHGAIFLRAVYARARRYLKEARSLTCLRSFRALGQMLTPSASGGSQGVSPDEEHLGVETMRQ
jgi:hypothetical protein